MDCTNDQVEGVSRLRIVIAHPGKRAFENSLPVLRGIGEGGVDVHLKEQLVPRPLSYLGHQLSKRFELVVLKENIA